MRCSIAGFPLTLAMNSLSRSLGHSDFYPFVIPVPARPKLMQVHELVRDFVRAREPARAAHHA